MSVQESQVEYDINVHFVVPKNYESENDCGEEMWQAFNVRIFLFFIVLVCTPYFSRY